MLTFLVLNLLANNCRWATTVILKGYAVLANMRCLVRVIGSRGDKVDATGLERSKPCLIHHLTAGLDGNIATLVKQNFFRLSATQLKNLAVVETELSNGDI